MAAATATSADYCTPVAAVAACAHPVPAEYDDRDSRGLLPPRTGSAGYHGYAGVATVGEWLEKIGLGKCAQVFEDADITFDVLAELTEEDLKELGVSLGQRKALLKHIRQGDLPRGTSVSTPVVPATEEQFERSRCIITGVVKDNLLGSGAFGDVFHGLWQGNEVAVKTVKNRTIAEELLREARTALQLRHPNVVQFFGLFLENGLYHMVTEFMPLKSLSGLFTERPNLLHYPHLVRLAKDACSGMVYLSSLNIIHRDLACRNLLCKTEGSRLVGKIADFGLSRELTAHESEYVAVDTADAPCQFPVRWTAPEGITSRIFTTKSDVWSFGVTLWEIMSYGARPYETLGNPEVIEKVVQGLRLNRPEACPPQLYDAVMKQCWIADPRLRPSFEQLNEALASVVSGLTEAELAFSLDSKPEDVATCVQCGKPFCESTNNDTSCKFHARPIEASNFYPCCQRDASLPACQTARHSLVHNADFPYEAFHTYAAALLGRITEEWAYHEQWDPESNSTMRIRCGLVGNAVFVHYCMHELLLCRVFDSTQLEDVTRDSCIFDKHCLSSWVRVAWDLHSSWNPGLIMRWQNSDMDTPREQTVFFSLQPLHFVSATVVMPCVPIVAPPGTHLLAMPTATGETINEGKEYYAVPTHTSTGTAPINAHTYQASKSLQHFIAPDPTFFYNFFLNYITLTAKKSTLVRTYGKPVLQKASTGCGCQLCCGFENWRNGAHGGYSVIHWRDIRARRQQNRICSVVEIRRVAATAVGEGRPPQSYCSVEGKSGGCTSRFDASKATGAPFAATASVHHRHVARR
eukprot:TRINITY_DN481_c0_g1_i8.p1 TRINITY_DN481_c0_g1~~TRINITY_DN481_c0_g1_i8.p1  ORF type:complete len:856 (+),score=101.89 TRINITY_DN481_c0_g1_i8:152-2569(+)